MCWASVKRFTGNRTKEFKKAMFTSNDNSSRFLAAALSLAISAVFFATAIVPASPALFA